MKQSAVTASAADPRPLVVMLGGTGFVGRNLAAKLTRRGYRVLVPSRNRETTRGVGVVPGVEVRNVDVYDRQALTECLRGASAAINLVGILNESGRDGRGFQRAHVDLTRTLIDACKDAGVNRLLQMSALNAGRGRSHYLRTRGEAEQLVHASGLAWTIFQPSVIFGREDGLFTRFAGLLKMLPVLPLARAGAKFAPVFVGDVAEAFASALQRTDSIGQTYELYGDQVMSLADIVHYTAHLLGRRRLIVALPDALARLQALACEFMPGKPFSTDNFLSLQTDSVGGIDGLFRLGIGKTPLQAIIPAIHGDAGKQARLDRCRLVR